MSLKPWQREQTMTYDEKKNLCQRVTLDGASAVVCGARLRFARVCHVPRGLEVEYAWETVKRVIEHGGEFRS